MRNHEIDEQLGRQLDDAYRAFVAARAQAIKAISHMMITTFNLARCIGNARADLRMSFSRWCLKYCGVFDVRVVRPVCAVAHRTHAEDSVETWQLRLLGLTATIHHSERPLSQQRKHKRTSWLSYISKSHEELCKMIERAGGVDKIPTAERQAILRQLGTLDRFKLQLNGD
jgi:hypothetical protein